MAKSPAGVGPQYPQVVVLFGATGDLARRKLLPGLFHLASAGFIPGCRVIGVSLDEIDADQFRATARGALDEFGARKIVDADWDSFAGNFDYVPLSAGPAALRAAVGRAEKAIGGECRRLRCDRRGRHDRRRHRGERLTVAEGSVDEWFGLIAGLVVRVQVNG